MGIENSGDFEFLEVYKLSGAAARTGSLKKINSKDPGK